VGELNRDEATRMLNNLPNGTFLIRVSNQGSRRGEHALSIRSVQHFCPSNAMHCIGQSIKLFSYIDSER